MSENKKCPKCEFENPPTLKFCGNCGSRLDVPASKLKRYEALGLLHFTGALYLLISIFSNVLVNASMLIMLLYAISGILGLLAGYQFFTGNVRKYTKYVSLISIIVGLAATVLLFVMGLLLQGVVGPAWVIFLVTGFALWMAFKPAKK